MRGPESPISPQQTSWPSTASSLERLRALFRIARGQVTVQAALTEAPGTRSEKMARVEAALLVADRPLSLRKLAQHATLVDAADAQAQVELLNAAYEQDDSPFRIERVATGVQLLTRPEFAAWLDKRHHRPARLKLSPPALETLTIVAYRQPVTRADVEAVRGVQSGEMLKQLMDRGLIRIAGEDDSLGRPYLYATTRQFLEQFGLQNLDDLAHSTELRQPATATTIAQPDVEDEPDTATETGASETLEEDAENEAAA